MPKWLDSDDEHYIILGTDGDALTSSILFQIKKNWKIAGYCDYNDLYFTDWFLEQYGSNLPIDRLVFLDMDVWKLNGQWLKGFGNHVTQLSENDIYNPKQANINLALGVHRDIYYQKACVSTTIQIMSYYWGDKGLPKDEESQRFFLFFDSTTKGYYSNRFGAIWLKNMDALGFKDEVIPILDATKSFTHWQEYGKQNGLDGKIIMSDDGYLTTTLDLQYFSKIFKQEIKVPEERFVKWKSFQYRVNKLTSSNIYKNNADKLFSLAITYPDKIKCSIDI